MIHAARVWVGTLLLHLTMCIMPPVAGMELCWVRCGLVSEVSEFMARERASKDAAD